jgi:hypothetical protein
MADISWVFVQLCLCFFHSLSLKGSFSHQFAPTVALSDSSLANLYVDFIWYQHILNSWQEVMSCSSFLPHNICKQLSIKRVLVDC